MSKEDEVSQLEIDTTQEQTDATKGAQSQEAKEGAAETLTPRAEGEGGFDVVEEKPEGEKVADGVMPLSTYRKKVSKWQKRVERARGNADALASENELLRLENEQLKQRGQVKARPKADDFAGDTEKFEKADRDWIRQQVREVATELRPAATEAAPRGVEDDDSLRAHYERATKLRAPDFDKAEDEVIEALGQDAGRQIIASFDNSEAVMYALGNNPKKLGEIAALLKASPVKVVVELTRYADTLQLKPRTPPPDPDSADDKKASGNSSDPQKTLNRMRDEVHAGKRKMADVLKFKRECAAKGTNLI